MRVFRWTAERDVLLSRLWADPDWHAYAVAAEVGCSPPTAYKRARDLGLGRCVYQQRRTTGTPDRNVDYSRNRAMPADLRFEDDPKARRREPRLRERPCVADGLGMSSAALAADGAW